MRRSLIPDQRRLIVDQRAAREGFGVARAADRIGRRSHRRLVARAGRDRVCRARGRARTFALDLALDARAPVLLQGDAGVSRKGPDPLDASFYYSQPQLAVSGSVSIGERTRVRQRRRLARSRMVEPLPGARCRRMGLDRHQSRRRGRSDGVSHPRRAGVPRRGPAARIAMRRARRTSSRRPMSRSPPSAAGDRRAPDSNIRLPSDAARRRPSSCCWSRCFPTRSSMRAPASVPCTGKVRCARSSGGRIAGRGYLELTGYGGALRL